MEYVTTKQCAESWGITANRISILCRQGRIPGAVQVGSRWMIPQNAEKPTDGRTVAAKTEDGEVDFRFPLYVNRNGDRFSPKMTEEECILREAECDYYSCNFYTAKKSFDALADKTDNIYIRIMSLYYLCAISVEIYNGDNYIAYFHRLRRIFSEDFPNKKDMEIVFAWLYTNTFQLLAVSENLNIDPFYEYSPSVQPLISYLSIYNFSKEAQQVDTSEYLNVYEIMCRQFIRDESYYEACELHFVLFLAYYVMAKKDIYLYHLKNGLKLAMEHNFLVVAASYENYYQNAFDCVLKEFPSDFAATVKRYSGIISGSIGMFFQRFLCSDIFHVLSKKDYRLILYAYQENTYKQIADILNISERTVANQYAEIFSKLGVKNKKELRNMIFDTISKSKNTD